MRRLLRVALVAGLVAQPVAVSGQLAPVPGASEYLRFVSANTALNSTFGVKVGPYVGQFTTPGMPTSALFSIYCVDYTHTATSQWVNATNLGAASPSLSNTRLGSYATYRQAAYLSSLFGSWQSLGYGTDQRTVWSGIHAAIWSVSNGVTVGGSSATTYSTGWIRDQLLGDAGHVGNANTYNTTGWYVISPDVQRGFNGQEFLIRTPPVSVPEPAAALLMATGLLFLATASRRQWAIWHS